MTRASPRRRSTRSRWRRASRHGRLLAGPHRRACARRSPKRSGRCAVERRHPAGRRRGRRRHARPHRAVRARGPHARAVSRLPPRAPARLRCRRGQRHTRSRSERQQEGRRGPAPYGIHGLLCASGPHARARRGALARGPSRGLGAGDRWRAGARFARNLAEYVLWGSVLAAAICAFVIATSGAGALAWVAIGYVLFGGALTAGSPHWGLVLLALALMPLVPRPNGSLVLGLGIAVVAAFASRVAIGLIL